ADKGNPPSPFFSAPRRAWPLGKSGPGKGGSSIDTPLSIELPPLPGTASPGRPGCCRRRSHPPVDRPRPARQDSWRRTPVPRRTSGALGTGRDAMTDHEAIQGLWRLLSHVSRGSRALTSVTHFLFEGDRVREVTPDLVDDGTVRSTFQIDPTTSPKR